MNKVDVIAWKMAKLSLQTLVTVLMMLIWTSFTGRIVEGMLLGTTIIGFVDVGIEVSDYFRR